jgi:hypothetical protein
MHGVFLDTSERKLDDNLEGANHPSYLIPLSRYQFRVAFLQLGHAIYGFALHSSLAHYTPLQTGSYTALHPIGLLCTALHCAVLPSASCHSSALYTLLKCAVLHCNQVQSRAAHVKNNTVNIVFFSVEISTANRSEIRQHLSSIRLI